MKGTIGTWTQDIVIIEGKSKMLAFIVYQKKQTLIFPDQLSAARYLDGPHGYKADDSTIMNQMIVISEKEFSELHDRNTTSIVEAESNGQVKAYESIIKMLFTRLTRDYE